MDENGLRIAFAGALVGAVCLGWVLHWLWRLMGQNTGPKSIKKTADLATRLHDAEEALFQAEATLAGERQAHSARVTELETELAQAHDRMREMRDAYEQVLAESRGEA